MQRLASQCRMSQGSACLHNNQPGWCVEGKAAAATRGPKQRTDPRAGGALLTFARDLWQSPAALLAGPEESSTATAPTPLAARAPPTAPPFLLLSSAPAGCRPRLVGAALRPRRIPRQPARPLAVPAPPRCLTGPLRRGRRGPAPPVAPRRLGPPPRRLAPTGGDAPRPLLREAEGDAQRPAEEPVRVRWRGDAS